MTFQLQNRLKRRFLPLIFMFLATTILILAQNNPALAACPASFPVTVPAGDTARLIEVIGCANASPSNDVINLTDSVYTLTSINTGNSGLPPVLASGGTLTINGNGATITRSTAGGTPQFRIFTVNTVGSLILNSVAISNGSVPSGNGGAILNQGTLALNDVSVANSTAATGGGIYSTDGILTILRSTVASNTAVSGGGIANRSIMRLINSTVSGNTVTGIDGLNGGGAMSLYNVQNTQITNSTITNNTAGIAVRSGIWLNQGTLTIQNSIVAGNNGENNCLIDSGTAFTDGGSNLDNGATCGFPISNVNPLLGVLANNGGFTQTHALLFNSPALNQGSNAKAIDHTGAALTTDARGSGYPRVNGGTVDIGAYEAVACVSPILVPAADAASLEHAMLCANGSSANDVINLTNSTYTLSQAAYDINVGLPPIINTTIAGTLTINGNGATITRSTAQGTPDFRIFSINGNANLTLNRVTLTNGQMLGSNGGAIRSYSGMLTLTASTISGNRAFSGGGIFAEYSTVVIRDSTLSGNMGVNTGGAMTHAHGTLTIVNSTISGNSTRDDGVSGGAMSLYGTQDTRIINSTVTNNTSRLAQRSGIWFSEGTLTIQNSIVAGNNGANNCSKSMEIGVVLIDAGNNLDNGTSCGFSGAVGQNTNPLLAPLANNGGFTQTHALLTGSPASNAGSNALAVNHNGAALTTDQRGAGFSRINNTTVDIGAYESVAEALNVTLTLQGRTQPAPHPSRVVTVHVSIMPSGGGTSIYAADFTTNQNGTLTIPGIPPGSYLVRFKGTHALAREASITITAGTNSYTTPLLLEGDANDDNIVSLSDFSILASSFGRAFDELGYDARADFNGDNLISLNDFSLLASNYGVTGDGGVLP